MDMELNFQESRFLVKTLSTQEEIEAGFRLRHEVFCNELKWVPPTAEKTEIDGYDSFSEYIGVFNYGDDLIAHARLITSPNPFMIEKEFACMMPEGKKVDKKPDVAEITRLCVKNTERVSHNFTNISQLIYKGIYLWSLANEMRHMVMVVDKRYFRLLRLSGFPVKALGEFVTMPDGVQATVISLDWREFEELSAERKPEFLTWMSAVPARQYTTLSDRYPSQSQLHGIY